MDLMNLALQYKDFEWARELVEMKEHVEAPAAPVGGSVKADLFNEESVALESITNTYAVRERIGIRAFNINSEFDRNLSDLVMVERPSYKKGEKVKYRSPSTEEMIFARGIVNGYILGYSEATNTLNYQLMEYLGATDPQTVNNKSGIGPNEKKITKVRKGKTQKM